MKSKYEFLVSDYKPQAFLQTTVDFFMSANYPEPGSDDLSKGFNNVRLFPTSTSVPNLATNLIGDQPSIGVTQGFDDQALLLRHVGDWILQSDIEFFINLELGMALYKVAYHSICYFEVLPTDFISGWHRGSTQRLISNFYWTVVPPVEQLTYLYQTSPCSVTWEPSLQFMTPRNAINVQSNIDFFTQLLSTCYMRTPFFGSVLDVATWGVLNEIYLEELDIFGNGLQQRIELFWANAHGRLHQPDLTIPLADQNFLRTAPLLWGLAF